MLKSLLIIALIISISACSKDYAEDDTYAYMKKRNIVCKKIKEQIVLQSSGRGGSYHTLDITSKCMFFKKESFDYNPDEIERTKKLEKELGVI